MTLSLLSPRTTQHDFLQLLFIMESSWRSMCLNQPLKIFSQITKTPLTSDLF